MTCIAAWIDHAGRAWIGGDSAAVSGWELDLAAGPKVFRHGSLAMGYTSSFRMGQALQYRLKLPCQPPERTPEVDRWMAVEFSDAVRETMREVGFLKNDSGREELGSFIVLARNLIYNFDDDMHVRRTAYRFHAIGCGAPAALGALHAITELAPTTPGQFAIEAALSAAQATNIGVRAPFTVIVP